MSEGAQAWYRSGSACAAVTREVVGAALWDEKQDLSDLRGLSDRGQALAGSCHLNRDGQ